MVQGLESWLCRRANTPYFLDFEGNCFEPKVFSRWLDLQV